MWGWGSVIELNSCEKCTSLLKPSLCERCFAIHKFIIQSIFGKDLHFSTPAAYPQAGIRPFWNRKFLICWKMTLTFERKFHIEHDLLDDHIFIAIFAECHGQDAFLCAFLCAVKIDNLLGLVGCSTIACGNGIVREIPPMSLILNNISKSLAQFSKLNNLIGCFPLLMTGKFLPKGVMGIESLRWDMYRAYFYTFTKGEIVLLPNLHRHKLRRTGFF